MHNDVFNITALEEAKVVGYADEIALAVVTKHLEDAELYSCETISAIIRGIWSDTYGGKHRSGPHNQKHSTWESYHHF